MTGDRTVSVLDEVAFEERRASALRAYGQMTFDNGQGFLMDLDYALEEAGVVDARISWIGERDRSIVATGRFRDLPDPASKRILNVLADRVSYGDDQDAAAVVATTRSVRILFATWTPLIGVASVNLEIETDDR